MHARIQTMGVAEHVFDMSVHGRTVRWHLFDVGGARGQRHSWIPYFDDAYVACHYCVRGPHILTAIVQQCDHILGPRERL